MRTSPQPGDTPIKVHRVTEAEMTARNATAEWHGNDESRSGTIAVADEVFEGGYPSAHSQHPNLGGAITLAHIDLATEGDLPGVDERRFPSMRTRSWDISHA